MLGELFFEELKTESRATRACLERIPLDKVFNWKPHPKSMEMGYLALLCAEIPKWITLAIEQGEVDFGTFSRPEVKTTEELIRYFDDNMAGAEKSLQNTSDADLERPFQLKNNGALLSTSSKKETVEFSINHLVHHRGQLTVYMRLNEIPVPSIYGPSADEKSFD